MQLPKIGSDIYVPTQWYIDRGEDDISGGLAEVKKIEHMGNNTFIHVREVSNAFNWDYLKSNQEEWKKEYGQRRACPDPDYQ